MKNAIILLALLSICIPAFAEEQPHILLSKAFSQKDADSDTRIVTNLGTISVGMPADELYKIFRERDRVILPHKILTKEWVVFNNWTTENPNDVITFHIKNGRIAGWENRYNPAPENEKSAYKFDGNPNIGAWFFPTDRTRWDGSKMTLLEWNNLVAAQKVMFIREYIEQVNKKFHSNITVDVDKYMLAMDYYADNATPQDKNIPLTMALNDLLIQDGKAKEEK